MKHFQGLQHEIFSSTLSSCCRDWAAGMLLRANLQLLADLLHLFTIKSAYISFFLLLSCRSNPPYPPLFFFGPTSMYLLQSSWPRFRKAPNPGSHRGLKAAGTRSHSWGYPKPGWGGRRQQTQQRLPPGASNGAYSPDSFQKSYPALKYLLQQRFTLTW